MKQRSDKSFLQFARYILVGGFNTVFGYGVFALINWLSRGMGSYNYMFAALVSSLISITVAFLGYKWFVFRTRGNYLLEWIRCVGVYSASMAFGLVSLPILVTILRHHLQKPEQASYIAGAILTVLTPLFSFVGHKKISFRQKQIEEIISHPKTPSP